MYLGVDCISVYPISSFITVIKTIYVFQIENKGEARAAVV